MKRFFLYLVVVIAASTIADIYTTPSSAAAKESGADSLPRLGTIPPFSLTESTETPFTSEALKGKIWVASFFFTNCPHICPRMNREVAKLVEQYAANPKIEFVSITIDPEHDTAAVLKEYKTKLTSNGERWHLLTGPVQQVRTLAEETFKVGGYEDKDMHSTRLIVIDSEMNIRGYFPALEDEGVLATTQALNDLLK